MSVRLLVGDCRDRLRELADGSVQCVVTSPPYFGLRDYGVAGQIGLEATPDAFVAEMVAVFREVRRVLTNDGTLWLNLGDSYANDTKWGGKSSGKHVTALHGDSGIGRRRHMTGLKSKDLVGVPWRVAFALQAPDYLGTIRRETDRAWLAALTDGEGCITILEAKSGHDSGSSYPPILQVRMCDRECIDHAMAITGSGGESPPQYPASMEGQRPAFQWRIHGRKAADTIAEIYPFLLIKRKQAIVAWNHQAVRGSYETKRGVKIPVAALEKQKVCRDLIQRLNKRVAVDLPSWMVEPPALFGPGWYLRQDLIWSKPNPMPESVRDRCTKAHEYVFMLSKSGRYFYDQDAIAEPAIYSGLANQTPSGYKDAQTFNGKHAKPDKQRGHGRRHAGFNDRRDAMEKARQCSGLRNKRSVWEVATQPFSDAHFATFPPALIEPCVLAGSRKGDTVLDPFGGAGTTGLVADRLGRDAILIELNPDYAEIARKRITDDAGMFAEVASCP